jgi:hypothetical protein
MDPTTTYAFGAAGLLLLLAILERLTSDRAD